MLSNRFNQFRMVFNMQINSNVNSIMNLPTLASHISLSENHPGENLAAS